MFRMLTLRRSNDSDKQIHTKSQAKACSSMSCTLFALWGSWFLCLFYALFYLLFATYLRQDKKVDNVGQNPTNLD